MNFLCIVLVVQEKLSLSKEEEKRGGGGGGGGEGATYKIHQLQHGSLKKKNQEVVKEVFIPLAKERQKTSHEEEFVYTEVRQIDR